MRFFKVLMVLAIALSLTAIAYAETQSVKISGDLTMRTINRGAYDLNDTTTTASGVRTGNQDPWQNYYMTTAEIQLDADLTDNVSAVIRLYNQRDWNVTTKSIMVGTAAQQGYTANATEFAVGVDLAYVELKEFLYSPLTLKIGRQDIFIGRGFVVGGLFQDPTNSINAMEYSCVTSFDAIRATLDYDPWTIDAFAALVGEGAIDARDDIALYGINVGYIFDVYNAETEAYWFLKDDRSLETWNIKQHNTVANLGMRGSFDPIENWTVAAEGAVQFGNYVGSRTQLERRSRSAYAIDAMIECRYFQEKFAWKPKLGVEYIYYSGNKNIASENPQSTGSYTGWDIMYRGKWDSKIRDYQGLYYISQQDLSNQRLDMLPTYPDAAFSNQHQIILMGSVQPTDSLSMALKYFNFWQQYSTYHRGPTGDVNAGDRIDDGTYLGGEIDLMVSWDYTEDVSFGLTGAWYFPGKHYYNESDDVATDVVGSMKLSF